MALKLSSIVMVLMMFFIAKISFDTAIADRVPERVTDRSPASIDQSYAEHIRGR